MSNLEHLIENGLCRLEEGKSYREWREVMQEDCNWKGNENITIDNLWEICQYVIYTWDLEKSLKEQEAEIERLKRPDCEHAEHDSNGCLGYCGCTQDDEPIESCKKCEKYTGNVSEAVKWND